MIHTLMVISNVLNMFKKTVGLSKLLLALARMEVLGLGSVGALDHVFSNLCAF